MIVIRVTTSLKSKSSNTQPQQKPKCQPGFKKLSGQHQHRWWIKNLLILIRRLFGFIHKSHKFYIFTFIHLTNVDKSDKTAACTEWSIFLHRDRMEVRNLNEMKHPDFQPRRIDCYFWFSQLNNYFCYKRFRKQFRGMVWAYFPFGHLKQFSKWIFCTWHFCSLIDVLPVKSLSPYLAFDRFCENLLQN